jgi:hypothetical protein
MEGRYIASAKFIDDVSSGITGVGLVALGAFLARMGVLIGGLDDDEDENYADMFGKRPYSLKFGKTLLPFGGLLPANLPMLMGAELYSAITNEGYTIADALPKLTSVLNSLSDLTVISSLTDALDLVAGNTYDDDGVFDKLLEVLKSSGINYIKQLVPSPIGALARTLDPVSRRSYIEHGKDYSLERQKDLFINQIPGLREEYGVPFVDAYGRVDTQDSAVTRIIENWFFGGSGNIGKDKTDELYNEVLRLASSTGDKGLYPKRPANNITVDGQKYYLNAEEYTKYSIEGGKLRESLTRELIKSPAYADMTDSERASMIKGIYSFADAAGKASLDVGYEPDEWVSLLTDAPDKEVLDVLRIRANVSDINGNKNLDGKATLKREAADVAGVSGDSKLKAAGMKMPDVLIGKVTPDTYFDYRISLDKVDKPNANGKLGTYTIDEYVSALRDIDVSGSDKLLMAGIDLPKGAAATGKVSGDTYWNYLSELTLNPSKYDMDGDGKVTKWNEKTAVIAGLPAVSDSEKAYLYQSLRAKTKAYPNDNPYSNDIGYEVWEKYGQK